MSGYGIKSAIGAAALAAGLAFAAAPVLAQSQTTPAPQCSGTTSAGNDCTNGTAMPNGTTNNGTNGNGVNVAPSVSPNTDVNGTNGTNGSNNNLGAGGSGSTSSGGGSSSN